MFSYSVESNIIKLSRSIQAIDGILTGTATPGQGEPVSNSNEVIHISKSQGLESHHRMLDAALYFFFFFTENAFGVFLVLLTLIYQELIPIRDNSVCGGARGVMVIVVGNGHGDTNSNPGRD